MKDVAKRAAELFSEKPGEHDWKVTPEIDICRKCGCKGYNTSPCTTSDPIDITDLGKALETFRGIASPENHDRLEKAIMIVVTREIDDDKGTLSAFRPKDLSDVCNLWLLYSGTAEQIWEICVLAKESEK